MQITYLIKDFYPECTRNSGNPTRECPTKSLERAEDANRRFPRAGLRVAHERTVRHPAPAVPGEMQSGAAATLPERPVLGRLSIRKAGRDHRDSRLPLVGGRLSWALGKAVWPLLAKKVKHPLTPQPSSRNSQALA